MKSREKLLLGIGILLIGGYFGVSVLVMPAIDSVMKKQAKLATTETEVTMLEAQIGALSQRVQQLKVMKELPQDVVIRKFKRNEFEASVKAMVDDVVQLATKSGNSLTGIKPWSAPSLTPPPPKNKKSGKEGAAPPPAPRMNVRSRGYELTLQGTYGPIHKFLTAVSDYPELIEVNNASFQHQDFSSSRGRGRGRNANGSSEQLHEDQPIRVIVKLILYLQPE